MIENHDHYKAVGKDYTQIWQVKAYVGLRIWQKCCNPAQTSSPVFDRRISFWERRAFHERIRYKRYICRLANSSERRMRLDVSELTTAHRSVWETYVLWDPGSRRPRQKRW